MCDVKLPLGQTRIPHFPVPDGETVEIVAPARSASAASRGATATVTDELQARLDYELGVITSMGYAGYFLIVADFIRYAREQGIQTTCRGSAPGSIVTYTLGITPVDPIAYGLPFERFLNPDRVTMPDIDVDFQDDRRDEVIAYVSRKYGQDHVAQIITFGTMLARAAIRDVGRVLGHSLRRGRPDREGRPEPARDQARRGARERRRRCASSTTPTPAVKRVIDFAKQLEGVARNASTHAAGVVISREPLTELMPLQKATNSDSLMTQYEMHAIEALGLLKFDFLGLSNLTILKNAVDLIKAHRGIDIDLDNIPLDDAKTFELLSTGETTGIFQLESAGMRRYVRELRPTSVFDLAAMVALYRPGPMDNIPAYIRRKHGQEPVTYLHPLLEPFLERTYGIFVYQEDIMAAAIALGGFTGPEADTLGYAIRKKKSSVLRAQKEKFVTQAAERGVPPADDRRGLRGVRAVRALRVQQGPRHVLRPHRVPDRLPQGELHGRLHGERPVGVPELRGEGRRGRRRVPPAGHRGPAAGRRPERGRVHGRGRGHPVRAAGRQERRPGRDRVDHRGARGRGPVQVARRPVPPDRPAARRTGRSSSRSPRSARCRRSGTRRRSSRASTTRSPPAPPRSATSPRARRRCSTSARRNRWCWSGRSRRPSRRRCASGCAGRRSCSACTCPSTRWARSPTRSATFVTAYSGDLKSDETLDGQRLVVGGIVVASRTVVTRTRSTMSVVTLEDLQGSIEVVVFPRLYEQTGPIWQEGAILLVAGRVDHRGEEVSLLADVVVPWDEAVVEGAEAFAREVAAGDRGAPRRRQPVAGWAGRGAPCPSAPQRHGNGYGANGNGERARRRRRDRRGAFDPRAGGLGRRPEIDVRLAAARRRACPEGGPLGARRARPVATLPRSPRRSRSRPTQDAPGVAGGTERDAASRRSPTRRAPASPPRPSQRPPRSRPRPPGSVLHVRFAAAPAAQLVAAMEAIRQLVRERPGETRVVVHVPGAGRRRAADGAAERRRLRRRAPRRGPAPTRGGPRAALGGATAPRDASAGYQVARATSARTPGGPGSTGTNVARPRRGDLAVDLDRCLDRDPIRRDVDRARRRAAGVRSEGVGRRNRTDDLGGHGRWRRVAQPAAMQRRDRGPVRVAVDQRAEDPAVDVARRTPRARAAPATRRRRSRRRPRSSGSAGPAHSPARTRSTAPPARTVPGATGRP